MKQAIGRGLFKVALGGAVGGGYVLGAKAGEERYEEIREPGAGRWRARPATDRTA